MTIPTVMEPAPTIDPTDKSNSPAIISRPTGIAMIPISEAVPSQLAVPPVLVNPPPPLSSAKNA